MIWEYLQKERISYRYLANIGEKAHKDKVRQLLTRAGHFIFNFYFNLPRDAVNLSLFSYFEDSVCNKYTQPIHNKQKLQTWHTDCCVRFSGLCVLEALSKATVTVLKPMNTYNPILPGVSNTNHPADK